MPPRKQSRPPPRQLFPDELAAEDRAEETDDAPLEPADAAELPTEDKEEPPLEAAEEAALLLEGAGWQS